MLTRNLSSRSLVGLCALLIVGCASSRNGPFLGEKMEDPFQSSPYNQPLNSGAGVVPDQQTTRYRGAFGFPFFGPSNGFAANRMPPPYRSSPQFHSGGPLGGLPPATQVYPTPAAEGSSANDQGPIELSQPIPADNQPTDDLGTQLGTPRTYKEPIPAYPDVDSTGPHTNAEETIRQRPDGGPLAAPMPSQAPFAPVLPDEKAFDPTRQPLVLTVSDPQQVLQKEAVRFEVVIRNPFSEAAEDVVIECRFDEGLTFPDMPDRALRQRLGTLGASESRTIDLALTAEQLGRHCVDFTLSAAGREDVAQKRCVDVVDPQTSVMGAAGGVAIALVGPPSRNAGGSLECVLTIENRTGHDVSGIVAAIRHDAALVPREASAGATKALGTLAWDLGLLRTAERVQIQVEYDCPTPSEHACVDAEVTGRDLPTQRQDVCVVIRPRPTLDVAVADARDPVPVGETTTYLVTVTNRGLESIGEIRLDVEVDGGLEILSSDQNVSEVALDSRPQPGPRTASFAITGTIEPDDSRQVRIDVRGTKIGIGGLRVLATELATNRRVLMEEPTIINPPLLDLPSFEDIAGNQ